MVTTVDAEMARLSLTVLRANTAPDAPLALYFTRNENEFPIELPPAVVRVLARALEEVARGHDVTVTATRTAPTTVVTAPPDKVELTTAEAASVLRVSRPHVIKLLDAGVIPHRKVGTHRRILTEDVLQYQQRTQHATHPQNH